MSCGAPAFSYRLLLALAVVAATTNTAVADPLDDLKQLLSSFQASMSAEQYRDAEDYGKRMIVLAEQVVPNRHDMRASFHGLMAECFERQSRLTEALPYRERAVELSEKAYGADSTKVADELDSLADCLWDQDRRDDSLAYYRRALTIREARLGAADEQTVAIRDELADGYRALGKYGEEEPLLRRSLELVERGRRGNTSEVGRRVHSLADCCWNQQRFDEAVDLYARAVAVRRKSLGPTHDDTIFSQTELAAGLVLLERYDDAEQVWQAMSRDYLQAFGPEDDSYIASLSDLGYFYFDVGRYQDALEQFKQVLTKRTGQWGADDPDLAYCLDDVVEAYDALGQYVEALKFAEQALSLRKKHLLPNDTELALSYATVAYEYRQVGRLVDAENYLKMAAELQRTVLGESHYDYVTTLYELGSLYRVQARYAESEALLNRALAAMEAAEERDDLDVAQCLQDIGLLYLEVGRYAESEPALRRALALNESVLGPDSVNVAYSLDALAMLFSEQSRLPEAEQLRDRAIRIVEASLGSEAVDLATLLNNQGSVYLDLERPAEAEKLLQRAAAIWEAEFGPDGVDLSYPLVNLASCYSFQKRFDDAEAALHRALKLREDNFGRDHPLTAEALELTAQLYHEHGRDTDAEPLLDRALAILERARTYPGLHCECVRLRAEIAWSSGRRREAILDLHHAMDLAEQVRGQSSGTEHERAKSFARFAEVFELMLQWQMELGENDEALAAIERSRARSLLDEMNQSGVDVNLGRSAAEREELRVRQAELQAEVAACEEALAAAESTEDREQAQSRLAAARTRLYDHYRNERNTSTVYRNLLAVNTGRLRMSQISRELAARESLLLVYFFGEAGGYLLAADAAGAKLTQLELPEKLAERFGMSAGPLTQTALQQLMVRDDRRGVVQRLAASSRDVPIDELHAVWTMIVPESVRSDLLAAKYRRLIIVPDGPLALLPFETMVTVPGNDPRFLLDDGPPILYGPSVTVWYNLAQRESGKPTATEAVLTVGDPQYQAPAGPSAERSPVDNEPGALTRYGRSGVALANLPHSGLEAGWVRDVFTRCEIGVRRLLKSDATEANVRAGAAGRAIVHLACHGLTDQNFGNFFGALALTPGPDPVNNAADDGFLTLAEIYQLDLRSCELAILSACETNYGPQQRGEGMWALSRGFLVAGARRVVASNWLVDDQAAANLISVYCDEIARAEQDRRSVDYAAALQTAKRYVRKQEPWRNPYYWATFVLVGPN